MQSSSVSKRSRKSFKSLALTSTIAIAATLFANDAMASRWHVKGDTLYYSGGVSSDDPTLLQLILRDAAAQGITLRRVVYRNSPGGAASGGVGMGRIIREAGLDTVLDGGCYSACADAFVGGVNRFYTDYDLPGGSGYDMNVLAIHGAASGGRPLPYPRQEVYIQYYRDMLGEANFAVVRDRIIQAHYELTQQSGFLRYFDPSKVAIPTRFCPTGDQSESGNCTAYPDVTMASDRMVTSPDYVTLNDRLFVTDDYEGTLNTGWMDGRVVYDSLVADLYDFHRYWITPGLKDAYGVVAVTPGANWKLNDTLAVPYLVVDGGTMTMGSNARILLNDNVGIKNGGMLRLDNARLTSALVQSGGLLAGSGTLEGTVIVEDGGTLLAQNMVKRPYLLDPIARFGLSPNLQTEDVRLGAGRIVTIQEGGTLAFDVGADTTEAGLKLVQARYYTADAYGAIYLTPAHRKSVLNIENDAELGLNVRQGYYATNQKISLVSNVVDNSPLARPVAPCQPDRVNGLRGQTGISCEDITEEALTQNVTAGTFIQGKFTVAKRLGDPNYRVDLTDENAVFAARENSLLTFKIRQTGDEIWLEANPAFEDTKLFGNERSGDGLGVALRTASEQADTPLAPLLGSLQFANRDTARRQAGALRGDGHASMRLVGRAFIDQFSDALFSASRNPTAITGQPMVLGQNDVAPTASSMAMTPVDDIRYGIGGGAAPAPAPATVTPRSPYDLNRPTMVWATGFGQTGKLRSDGQVAGIEYNGYGTIVGASRELSDTFRLGAAIGYGRLNTNTRPRNNFNGQIESLMAAVTADGSYSRGYLSGQAGYVRLKNDTRRSVSGIEGLEGGNRAEYNNDAWFARFEHGFDLMKNNATAVTLLAPVVDYAVIEGTSFKDQGKAPTALQGEIEKTESLRAGLGLQAQHQIIQDDWRLTPYARVTWQREMSDRDATSVNRFALAPNLPFNAVSRELGKDVVEWNLGATSSTRYENVNLAVEYRGQNMSGQTSHGFQASVRYRF